MLCCGLGWAVSVVRFGLSSLFARAILGAVRGDTGLVQRWVNTPAEHKVNVNLKIKQALSAKDTAMDPINRKVCL